MKKIKFLKMQGAGNDFVVLDLTSQKMSLNAPVIRQLADRRFGIGADQVLILENTTDSRADFKYRIFNNSGEEVEQCGNGARCIGKFVHVLNLTDKSEVKFETQKGIISVLYHADGRTTAYMAPPQIEPASIPFKDNLATPILDPCSHACFYELTLVQGNSVKFQVVSMGNPHAVIFVENVDEYPVHEVAQQIQQHQAFPEGVNVGFVEVLSAQQAKIRVYERGAGETLACGTGTCAAFVAGYLQGLWTSEVDFIARGGVLTLGWRQAQAPMQSIALKGQAQVVFSGEIEIAE